MAQLIVRRPAFPRARSWAARRSLIQERWADLLRMARQDPRLFLWTLLWLPFWLGSEAPPARLPGQKISREHQAFTDPAGAFLASKMDRLVRTFRLSWMAGSLVRGVTLALLVLTIGAALAVIELAPLPGWPVVVAIVIGGVLAGGLYGWMVRPDRLIVAAMLDRTFGLDERIITAFDRPLDSAHVSRLQLADAANTFEEIVSETPRSQFLPVREVALCLIMAGALVTVLLAYVPQQAIAAISDSPAPQFVPASERLAVRDNPIPDRPTVEEPASDSKSIAEIQEQGRESQTARDDLARIGDALQRHAITQPAADAIASGEYGAAADSLREASASAGSMDQASRDALADDLEQAASDVSESNPDLAKAANDAADALREGGTNAESALSDLADQVDEAGERAGDSPDGASDLNEHDFNAGDSPSSTGSQGGEQAGNSQAGAGNDGQASSPGEGSDPGEGSAAQPGVSNQPQAGSESGSGGSDPSQGGGEQGGGSSPSEGAGQQPSDAQQGQGAGDSSSSAPGGGDGTSNSAQEGISGAPDDETSASQGSGAGTGQSGANDQPAADQTAGDSASAPEENPDAEVPGAGKAGDPPPSRGQRGEQDDSSGSSSGGSSTLELQGTSDEGVQTGGDSGTSSLGSGSGSSTANGDQSQGEVGVAGPDSNSVPVGLRDVVKDFFGGPQP